MILSSLFLVLIRTEHVHEEEREGLGMRLDNSQCRAKYYKWKNHFVEMKGDVGMSVHEKRGKQVNATPTHKTIYNPIPTSL